MYDVEQKVGVLRFVEDRKQETLFPIIQVCLGVFMSVYLFRSVLFVCYSSLLGVFMSVYLFRSMYFLEL